MQPSPITLQKTPPQLDAVDTHQSCEESEYKDKLESLQKSLKRIQQAYYHQNRRAIIVLEGWDAAGKGGTIRRMVNALDPRGYRVHPIAAPSEEEQGRHYLYRFYRRLPRQGV